MRKLIDLSDVVVPKSFSKTQPNEKKMERCRSYYHKYGCVDKDIIVNKRNILIDGYIRYLVLLENNVKSAIVEVNIDKTIYVFGKHPGANKEYVWKITNITRNQEALGVGKIAIVEANDKLCPVEITRIEILTEPPVFTKIKSVYSIRDKEKKTSKNKYNLTMNTCQNHLVVGENRSKICEPLFWRNNVIGAWCISGSTKRDLRDFMYDTFWIGVYDDDAKEYAGKVRVNFTSCGDMCGYNFEEFYDEATIENEDDLLIQQMFLETMNMLLDEDILEVNW